MEFKPENVGIELPQDFIVLVTEGGAREIVGDDIVDAINADLDSQPEDPAEDEWLSNINEPEYMPSYMNFHMWRNYKVMQLPEIKELEDKIFELHKEIEDKRSKLYEERDMELCKEYHEEYFLPYREELKKYWSKRGKGLDECLPSEPSLLVNDILMSQDELNNAPERVYEIREEEDNEHN